VLLGAHNLVSIYRRTKVWYPEYGV